MYNCRFSQAFLHVGSGGIYLFWEKRSSFNLPQLFQHMGGVGFTSDCESSGLTRYGVSSGTKTRFSLSAPILCIISSRASHFIKPGFKAHGIGWRGYCLCGTWVRRWVRACSGPRHHVRILCPDRPSVSTCLISVP